jgi:parvulin-like peptidyl-prolyl isomerase
MKRLLILILGLALLAAACGSSSSAAATVNGTDLTTGDIDDLFYEVTEEFTAEQTAAYLSTLIQWTAVEQSAQSELGYETDQEAIDAEIETILFDSGYVGDLDGFLSDQNVSKTGLERYANQVLIEDAVVEEVTPTVEKPTLDDAQSAIDAAPLEFTEVCASHILVETEEEAQAVVDRLNAGEDFATVAAEVSIDSGSGADGGSLGCGPAASYVPAFAEATAAAEIGKVTEPIETEFGYHLILVESRTVATPEDVLPFMEEQMVNAATDAWLLAAVTAADVTVEAEYGTWEIDPSPQVVPPPA